ncbi:hypothetical protein CCH79_00020650, partial [Gambusia affinis]
MFLTENRLQVPCWFPEVLAGTRSQFTEADAQGGEPHWSRICRGVPIMLAHTDQQAEEELKKAQKVFDELNVGLQDELPTLWDRRVGFYISTFKCVTSLEAKFHREISLVCRELYEVMTKLREQHSDKIFTIQGAPSDSGPLRLARTPSPPEDETPPESPDASSNHMLHPVSPGPPRPKSPIQGNAQPTQPAADAGFVADWSADFGSMSANGDVASATVPVASGTLAEGEQVGVQGGAECWPQAESSLPAGDTTAVQDSEPRDEGDEDAAAPSFFTDFDKMNESESTEEVPAASLKQTANEFKEATAPPAGEECASASLLADDDFEQQPLESKVEEAPAPPAGKAQEHQALTDEEDEKPSQNQQEEPATKAGSPEKPEPAEVPLAETKSSGGETAPSEKMPIPSVVIEPASSNEGDDDRDADIISPTAVDDATATPQSCSLKHISPSGGGSGFPDDFLYKAGLVETLHDFEAANSDELELKRGDVVLVVPTASMEDQEAGWLTGIKESDWSNLGVGAQRGLFPENFTQREQNFAQDRPGWSCSKRGPESRTNPEKKQVHRGVVASSRRCIAALHRAVASRRCIIAPLHHRRCIIAGRMSLVDPVAAADEIPQPQTQEIIGIDIPPCWPGFCSCVGVRSRRLGAMQG